MPARSIAGQATMLQKEVTPGTAIVTAMKKIEALKLRPTLAGEATPFKGLSGKVATTVTLPDLTTEWSADAVQCFNAIGYVAASRISTPVITTPGGGTLSRQAVFTLNPDGADAFQTYTAQWGDTTQAIQATYGVFQSLGLQIERGNLAFTTSFLSRDFSTGATLASGGVTTVPAAPIPPRSYDVWADDTWGTIGTTKLLACYRMNLNLADKYDPDAPINSALTSYESVIEKEDQDYGSDATFGFDANAISLINTFKAGAKKYFRVKAITTNFIETTIPYSIQVDFAAVISSTGEITTAPNSGAVVLPLNFEIARDSAAANSCVLTLVNTQLAY
jgi:hypothetical protein